MSRSVVISMRRQVLSFLFFSTMSGLLLAAMVLSVWMGMSHGIVTLSLWITVLGSCSYHRFFSSMPNSHLNAKLSPQCQTLTSMPNCLQIVQCMCAAALLLQWMYSVLASSGHPETRWAMVSSKRPHSLRFGSTSGFLRMLCWYQRVGRL